MSIHVPSHVHIWQAPLCKHVNLIVAVFTLLVTLVSSSRSSARRFLDYSTALSRSKAMSCLVWQSEVSSATRFLPSYSLTQAHTLRSAAWHRALHGTALHGTALLGTQNSMYSTAFTPFTVHVHDRVFTHTRLDPALHYTHIP